MSNCHYTAKTTAKRNVQRTAHSIIQKGRPLKDILVRAKLERKQGNRHTLERAF